MTRYCLFDHGGKLVSTFDSNDDPGDRQPDVIIHDSKLYVRWVGADYKEGYVLDIKETK